jgi:hypothetical protein
MAHQGIPSFICAPNAKQPLTKHGLHDATTDQAIIYDWFRRWPGANVGMPTGPRSGFVVADLDCKRAGADGLATLGALEVDLGQLPETLTVQTPSGGEHRYFRVPAAVVIRNSAGRVLGCEAPGLDVRGVGGYVLAAGSAIDGVPYRVTRRLEAAELPPSWIAVLAPTERRGAAADQWKPATRGDRSRADSWCVRALQREARDLAETPAGSRNDRLWRSAAALGGLAHAGGIDVDDVRAALLWACSSWPRRDARKDADTLERGLAFGLANPRDIQLGDVRAD